VMTATATSLASDGASEITATAGGIQAAFVYGAIISLFAIPAAFFVRKPAVSADAANRPPLAH
jgi:DHA2 family lincomycin resistance protein-like MFS transporter